MKDFGKTLLAVICGILIVQLLGVIFFLISIGSMAAVGSSTVLPREGVLDINMKDISLVEQAQEQMPAFSPSGVEMKASVGIWDAVCALKTAASDPGVKYVLLRADELAAGISTTEEFRLALSDFRKSGKSVVAYTENPGNGSLYLASVADKIYMSSYHGGNPTFIGVSGRMIFLKDLFDKLGVNYQLIRHGKFKSAGEMYIKNAPSEENRLQNKAMIDGIWKTLSGTIAEARGIPVETLNELVDNLKLNFPEDFLQAGLVDELLDHEGIVSKLCMLAQVEKAEDLHLIPFADYVEAKKVPKISKANVAILFADGSIVDGDQPEEIAADRFVKEIDKIRKDESVKSVVLRVNSPGGSVVASEKIRTALNLLMAEKPLVASYGNYAASGGYWISNGCQKIFSDATTLTGSIGVFSLIPEFSALSKKVGVNMVSVPSNRHSDMYSLTRPFDKTETEVMQNYIEDIYGSFIKIVSEGRDIPVEKVDEIAQGRVWVGSDALGINLVDQIGSLTDAVNEAASLAGFVSEDDYAVLSYPKPLTVLEQIMQALGKSNEAPSILAGTPFEAIGRAIETLREDQPSGAYAQLPYSIEIK